LVACGKEVAVESLRETFLRVWEALRERRDAPDGVPLFTGDYRTAAERDLEPRRFPEPPPPAAPYDGSVRRRRYWKKVAER
jgi:hypothetical protein